MLDIITYNPYRVLGLYSNSLMKDIVANEGKMKAFLKVGRAVSYPLDLPSILPTVERSEQIVANAKSQIALPDDKVKFAQFWFLKSTPIDNIAFNHLFSGDFDGAVETFKKKRCASSLQNLVVCYLIKENYQAAVQTAASLYSDFSTDLIKTIDPQASADNAKLINHFIDCLINNGIDLTSIKDSIADTNWTSAINSRMSQPLIEGLEKALETAKQSRGQDCNARLNAGKKLMAIVKIDLPKLKGVLDSLQYQILADELANEILQCGIDYFNNSDDNDDAVSNAMSLQEYALSIAVGSLAKERCHENVNILQKIITNLPPEEVRVEARAIKKELERFCKLPDEISHSLTLLKETKPHVQAIKNKLGRKNTFYLKISTQVVENALHNVIEEVNNINNIDFEQKYFDRIRRFEGTQIYKLTELTYKINPVGELNKFKTDYINGLLVGAWRAIRIMDSFDITKDFKKNRYRPNRDTLASLCCKMSIPTPSGGPVNETLKGCLRGLGGLLLTILITVVFIGIIILLGTLLD